MKNVTVLTKPEAAKFLGLSISTFDRWRCRVGLKPVERPLKKPVVFDRETLQVLKRGVIPVRNTDTGRIMTLPEIKARAKKGGRNAKA